MSNLKLHLDGIKFCFNLFVTNKYITIDTFILCLIFSAILAYSLDCFIIALIITVIIFIVSLLAYYLFIFKKVIIIDKRYWLIDDDRKYIRVPGLVIDNNFDSRFSFKIKLFAPAISKIKDNDNKLTIWVKSPKTINITLTSKNSILNDKFEEDTHFFGFLNEYEDSNYIQLSFSVIPIEPKDIDKIRVYLGYGDILNDIKNIDSSSKYCIHEEKVYFYNEE